MLKIYYIIILFTLSFFGCKAERKNFYSKNFQTVDSSIRSGQLPNGFTYFIKSLPDLDDDRLYMRFFVKAGTNQQDPDQFEVAHGLEHLSFKGTRHFPEGLGESDIIKQVGMGIYDYYAYTSNRFTEYFFDAPENNSKVLETGMLWFKDIANGLELSTSNIEYVMGEMYQEKLEKRNDLLSEHDARYQLQLKLFPCLEDNSNSFEHYEKINPEIFSRFYKDWYRPDLFTINIVGNFEDLDEIEERIKDTYSDLKSRKNPRIPRDCDNLYFDRPPQFFVIERSYTSSQTPPDQLIELQLVLRDSETMQNLDNALGTERLMLLSILRDLMMKRLNEATASYNSFDVGVKDTFKYDDLPLTLMVQAEFKNQKFFKESFPKILMVLQQLKAYGITKAEWLEIKSKYLDDLNPDREEKAKFWLDAFKEFYRYDQVLTSDKLDHKKEIMEDLTIEEFNQYAQRFLSEEAMDVGIIVPERHPLSVLKESDVRSWIADAYNDRLLPYEFPSVPEYLMSPGEVSKLKSVEVKSEQIEESGAHEFVLENGVKLVLKPLNPNPGVYRDKIMIHGFVQRGANCFPEEDFFSAVYAPSIIGNSGVNDLNKFEINRFLSRRGILPGTVYSYIDSHESGMLGYASLNNLESILQLLFLHFTNPNNDKEAFDDWKSTKLNSDSDARGLDFRYAIKRLTGDESVVPLMILGTKFLQKGTWLSKGIDKVEKDASYDIFQSIFGNAKDFTFVVSGDFELDSVFPILAKYFGNLPSQSYSLKDCTSLKPDFQLPPGPHLEEIPAIGDYEIPTIKYGIKFIEGAIDPADWKEHFKIKALAGVATQIAWGLRFKKNYSLYNIGVGGKLNQDMKRYEVSSYVDCVPKEYPMIRKEMHQIFEDIKLGKISEDDFRKGMARMYSIYNSEGMAGRHFMLHQNFYKHYRYDQPWIEPEEMERFVKSITIDDIIQTARKYITEENRYEFVTWNKEIP